MEHLLQRKKGSYVGKTKRGKGTKIMAIADGSSLPVAVSIASASPHEITLAEAVLDSTLVGNLQSASSGIKHTIAILLMRSYKKKAWR